MEVWAFVSLKIMAGSFIAPFLMNRLGSTDRRTQAERITLQFFFAICLAIVGVVFFGNLTITPTMYPIAVVGFIIPIGVFFQWRALAISPSRTALFMALIGVVAMMLAGTILQEWKEINPQRLVGIVVILIGITFFMRADRNRSNGAEKSFGLSFYLSAAVFTAIFGGATFLMRHWAVAEVTPDQFLTAWYSGAFIGSLMILIPVSRSRLFKRQQVSSESRWGKIPMVFAVAVAIFLSLRFQFQSFELSPLLFVLPVYQVGDMVGPVVIGLFLLSERKDYSPQHWRALVVSIVGALTIIFG